MRRKRTITAGALPLVVAASLAGVPAAGADDIIIEPPAELPGQGPPGLPRETALLKLGELGLPGNTESMAIKRPPGANKVANIILKRA